MQAHPLLSRTLLVAGMLAVAFAAITGCSQLPTAPVSSHSTAGSASLSPDPNPTDPPSVEPTPAPPVSPTVQPPAAETSRWLDPLFGGVVAAGQFKVVVPPAALRQRALITVRQPRLDERLVELEVSPASANGFNLPVLLIANCSDMDTKLLSLQTIWWWNPGAQRWDAVLNVQINLLGRTLTAPLWHFSTYKVGGKAGW